MINVGKKNKWALIQLLQQDFDARLAHIKSTEMFHHDFSREAPVFRMTVEVDAEKLHRVILEKELSDCKKQLARLSAECEPRITQ